MTDNETTAARALSHMMQERNMSERQTTGRDPERLGACGGPASGIATPGWRREKRGLA